MSKRGAEEYITKEHGSIPNFSSEEGKVKMATAAQMAKRKMAVPKSRAGRSGHSPMPGAGSSNPFAGTSTFGAPQQQTFSSPGAVSFGASQSFPPGDTSSNDTFNFSVPGQSASFTFGQPAPNNPFASLNGGAGSQQQANQDSGDAMMESPQKKPAFGSGVFGSGNTETAAPITGFSFGQPSNQPAFSFGQSQSQSQSQSQPQTNGFGNDSTTSVFGQNSSKPQESSTTTNIFGQSTQSQSNPPATNSVFGQSTSATQPSSQPSAFSFGQPATTSAPSSKPAFSFGQTSSQPSSNGALFGGLTQTSQPAFGSSTPASQPASSTPSFGAAPTTSTNNVFGGFGSPKPSETTPTPEPPSQPLFGQPAAPASSGETQAAPTAGEAPKGNPFASLFGQKPAEAASSPAADTPKPLFNFASSAQPSGLFSTPTTGKDATPKPAGETPQKPLFNFGNTTPVTGAREPPTSSNPFAGLSSKKPEPPQQDKEKSVFGDFKSTPSKPTSGSQALPAFGSTPAPKPLSSSLTPSTTLLGSSEKPQAATPSAANKRSADDDQLSKPTQQTPLFGSATPKAQEANNSSSFNMFAPAPKAALTATATPANTAPIGEAPTRAVNTNPPTRIPPYLDGNDYKAYDSNYRLHSLNREFQKRIASLDPSHNDFENIVRNYVAARESIGESIGLYTRNIAGMKRKADDKDDRRGDDQSSKKARSDEEGGSKSAFATGTPASSVFAPVPSSSSKPTANFAATSPTKKSNSAFSNASSLFNSMIPKSNSQPESTSGNPFANLSKSSTSAREVAAKPTFSFGDTPSKTPAAGSTTPTKSPPKKAALEMPKFTAPAGGFNFTDAFKKQSDVNAKKFADEAKEKRKAEDFDSEDDDEEEWNRKYEEEERAKRAKVASVAQKGFAPVFGSGAPSSDKPIFGFGAPAATTTSSISSSIFGQTFGKSSDEPIDISDNDADESRDEGTGSAESGSGDNDNDNDDEDEDEENDDLPEDDVEGDEENEEDEELETTVASSGNKGKSLFERVTPNPKVQKSAAAASANGVSTQKESAAKPSVFSSSVINGTPEAPSFSPLTPAGSKEHFVPSKTFNFTPTPPTTSSTPTPGASIFAGGLVKDGPVTGEGLFGSRPGTPSNADKAKSNVFGQLGTPAAPNVDQTWKKGSEIRFGPSDKDTPTVSVTEATPKKEEGKPFGNLFGANTSAANNTSSGSGVGFSFGQSPVPGFLAAATHLGGGSGTTSGLSSRATSPGTTDNESVATNEEDYSNDAQVSLMETRPGEENEKVISETRARAMRYYTEEQIAGTNLEKGWNGAGLGIVRLLKHRQTGKTRMVMRAEPGANIILNTNLQPEVKYEAAVSGNNGSVKFSVFTNEGVQSWLLKVKTLNSAEDLAKTMEENKTAHA